MGRSDPRIIPFYLDIIDRKRHYDAAAFLGFSNPSSSLITGVNADVKDLYDIELGNWNINSEWTLPRKYDLIVCTRCPYFAEDPAAFLRGCMDHLEDEGVLLVDWGLGDHWRFDRFRVGWRDADEHEHATYGGVKNKLWSCFWRDEFDDHGAVHEFRDAIRRRGYDDERSLSEIVSDEVPHVTGEFPDDALVEQVHTKFMWPDDPQLYIVLKLRKYMSFADKWRKIHSGCNYPSAMIRYNERSKKEEELLECLRSCDVLTDPDVDVVFELGCGPATNLLMLNEERDDLELWGSDILGDGNIAHLDDEQRDVINFIEAESGTLMDEPLGGTLPDHVDLFMSIDHMMHLTTHDQHVVMNALRDVWRPKYILLREISSTSPNRGPDSHMPRIGHDYDLGAGYECIYDVRSEIEVRKDADAHYFIRLFRRVDNAS